MKQPSLVRFTLTIENLDTHETTAIAAERVKDVWVEIENEWDDEPWLTPVAIAPNRRSARIRFEAWMLPDGDQVYTIATDAGAER